MKDIDWIEKPIIGAAIEIVARGQTIDSKGDPIDLGAFYRMGKQKGTGKVAIIKLRNYEI